MSTSNYWTEQALAGDYHLGDPREARMIAEENGRQRPETCGLCGGEGHFRATVGAHQCISCRALRFVRFDQETRVTTVYWKQ